MASDAKNAGPYRVDLGEKVPGYTPLIRIVGPMGKVANETCGDYARATYEFWTNHLNAAYAAGRASSDPAAEIAALRAEVERLRGVLMEILTVTTGGAKCVCTRNVCLCGEQTAAHLARAALTDHK